METGKQGVTKSESLYLPSIINAQKPVLVTLVQRYTDI